MGFIRYGSCSSLVRHEAYCYIARKAGRDERRLSLDPMPNQSPKGRYGKIAWQKTGGRAQASRAAHRGIRVIPDRPNAPPGLTAALGALDQLTAEYVTRARVQPPNYGNQARDLPVTPPSSTSARAQIHGRYGNSASADHQLTASAI